MILPISSINNLYGGMPAMTYGKPTLAEITPTLSLPASKLNYVFYDIGNEWLIMNSLFFKDIHLKVLRAKENTELVEPIKDRIIKNPENISWYQNRTVIIFGLPVVFSTGLILGLLLK